MRVLAVAFVVATWVPVAAARADGLEVSIYGGQTLPLYEGRLVLALPGADFAGITLRPSGDLALDAVGRRAFGGAVSWQVRPMLAIEGRIDTAGLDIETNRVRYDLLLDPGLAAELGAIGLIPIRTASVTLRSATVPIDRITVVSGNVRVHIPGRFGVFASGGFSYLPDLDAAGTIPVGLELDGVAIPIDAPVQVSAGPSRAGHRFGGNIGVGVRVPMAPRLAVLGEARMFAFRSYALELVPDDAFVAPLLATVPTVQFEPRYFHAAVGLIVRF